MRQLAAFAVFAAALTLWTDNVDANLKGLSSFVRSPVPSFVLSPPVSPYVVVAALDRPSPGTQSGSLGVLYTRRGLVGGFAAGFLGAGFLGLFFGHGMFTGLNSAAAIFGLLFQLSLVVLLCRLIWTWWGGRNQPAFTGLSPRQLADPYLRTRHEPPPGEAAPPLVMSEAQGSTSTSTCNEG
jgi:predicted lipid-binding transport protein (Tim44 family)